MHKIPRSSGISTTHNNSNLLHQRAKRQLRQKMAAVLPPAADADAAAGAGLYAAPSPAGQPPNAAGSNRELVYENTYILSPSGYGGEGARFQQHKVAAILKAVLRERVERAAYDAVKAAAIAKHIAEDLRERVKGLGYDRYKLVIQVTLGQKKGQAMRLVSRCLWDASTDGYASEVYENESLYCVCQVFGLWFE